MKLNHNLLQQAILSEGSTLAIWLIENERFYYKALRDLQKQCDGEDGDFLLTDNGKVVNLSKLLAFTANPLALEHNPKKALTALYKQLNLNLAQQDSAFQVQELLNQIGVLLREMLLEVEGEPVIANTPDWGAVWKFYDVRFHDDYSKLSEAIFDYMRSARRYLDFQVFVFSGVLPFISTNDLQELVTQITYDNLQAVFIEGAISSDKRLPSVEILTVDRDLCEVK